MKAVRTSNDAIVVPSSGPVYHGQAGQTRTERVHLVEADGSVRSFEVHRVVNVTTDPELKPRALTGQLHRLHDGRELALPFVYHDPAARKFALVIPSSLAHLEMKEWARLMGEVAEDTSAPVPTYVRQGTTVLGLGALELFLEAGSEPEDDELSEVEESAAEAVSARAHDVHVREQSLGEREKGLSERERELSEQEHSMLRMAEDLTQRERSLQRREEQIEHERSGLRGREQQLESARAELVHREHEAQAKQGHAREQQHSAAQSEQRAYHEQLEALRLELHRHEQQIGALRTQLKVREQQLERVQIQLNSREQEALVAQAKLRAREREADVVPEGEWQDVAIDARAVVDEVETVVTQMPQPPPLPAVPERGSRAVSVPPPGSTTRSSSAPPARASSERPSSAISSARHVPAPPPSSTSSQRLPAAAPSSASSQRLPAAAPSQRAPSNTAPALRGGASTDTAPALRGGASSNASQRAPGAGSQRPAGRESAAPKRNSQRPSRSPTARPAEDLADERARSTLAPAAAQAVALEPLRSEAPVSQRPRKLSPAPITAPAARSASAPASQPLRASAVPIARVSAAPAANAPQTRKRSEPPPAAPPPAQSASAEALTSADLRRRLDDPTTRMDAIFELCRRGHPAAITPIFKVLGALSPEDVATTVVLMLALGAGVAGGLVESLDSPSQDVRHAAALGLGQLKLSETLVPLLRRIETETTPSWAEMARALGDYGSVALSIVVGALPSSERRERLMVGLAHLANHGCSEELKSLENDPDSSIALASRQALARCTRMQAEDIAVRTQQPLRDNSPEARFSQVFFATLAAAG